jgi:hypothetical protein
MEKVTAESFTVRDERGGWLAQVVITSDGFLGVVSEYGNFAYAWRSFGDNFKEFLGKLNVGYFAGKMRMGIAYACGSSKKANESTETFARIVLPALQAAIKGATK